MGISIWQLVIVLVIVVLLFGTKKLRNIGGDLGGAIKSFRKAVKDGESVEEAEGGDKEAGKISQESTATESPEKAKEQDKA